MNKDLKEQTASEERRSAKRRKTGGQGAAVAVLVLVIAFSAVSAAGPAMGIDTDEIGSEIGSIGESIGIGEISVEWWQAAIIAIILTIVTCYLLRYRFEDETETQEKKEEQAQEPARRVSVGG